MKIRIDTGGLDDLVRTLNRIDKDCEKAIDEALESGAAVIADAVRASFNALPKSDEWGTSQRPRSTFTQREINILDQSFGISRPMNYRGGRDVKIGFGGYIDGKPAVLVARSINSGTSFSAKTHFFENATNRSKTAAKKIVRDVLQSRIDRLASR